MKKTVSPILFIVLLAACSKKDVATTAPLQSASADNEQVTDDCQTVKWVTDKDVYPRIRRITFNGCEDEYGLASFGSKFIGDRLDKRTAEPYQLVRTSVYAKDYKIEYSDGKQSAVSGKSNWVLLERTGNLYSYKVKVERSTTDEQNNTQTTNGVFFIKDIDDVTTQKTGKSFGSSQAQNSTSFLTTITSPVIKKSDFKYAVSGVVRVLSITGSTRHVQVLDYGDGTEDNKAMLSTDGAPAIEVTLPLENWAEYLEE